MNGLLPWVAGPFVLGAVLAGLPHKGNTRRWHTFQGGVAVGFFLIGVVAWAIAVLVWTGLA